jgi:hypothetical protein
MFENIRHFYIIGFYSQILFDHFFSIIGIFCSRSHFTCLVWRYNHIYRGRWLSLNDIISQNKRNNAEGTNTRDNVYLTDSFLHAMDVTTKGAASVLTGR